MSVSQSDYPVLIPYKIDFSTRTVGKHIRQTKRHVNWRFGFAHVPSLLNGKTGTACRGIEMDLHVIWSVASGKHEMYLNGQLIHHKLHSKIAVIPTQKFDYSVNVPENIIPGMHVIHVTAWALGLGEHANQNQFRFEFDGEEFRDFFGIFELGLPNMMLEYSKPMDIARKKISQRGTMDEKSDGSVSGGVLYGRPRRSMAAKPEENQSSEVQYWKEPVVSVYKQSSSLSSSRSGSVSSSHGFTSQDVATTDEDERRLIAEARALSLRESEESKRKHREEEEEQRQVAQARLNSFRDLNVSNDDMSVPSFARPHLTSRPHKSYTPMTGGLQPVEEDKDLLDLDFHDTTRPTNLVRTQSSVTLDTALRDDFGTGPSLNNNDDDDMSLASATYSHLDPTKMWKTQQDVSFIFQRPPVYADSLAGDLIQPSSSFSTSASFYGNTSPNQQSPMMYAGRHMGYEQNAPQQFFQTYPQSAPGPRPKTPPSFQAPPPPTFAVLNEAFGSAYASSNYSTNESYAPPTHGNMNYTNTNIQNPAAAFR